MEKVITCIESNIDNNAFSVEELAKFIGMSRSSFFNKLKSLSGMSPVEFIRDTRLRHAAKLIVFEKLMIKEACYLSGFSDAKYFGKCFKEKFNLTPLEYKKKHSATNVKNENRQD